MRFLPTISCLLRESIHSVSAEGEASLPICVKRVDIPVHLSPVRTLLGTLGPYQDPETSNSTAGGVGGRDHSVHRQYVTAGGDQILPARSYTFRRNSLPPRMPGVHSEPGLVGHRTDTRDRIPQCYDQDKANDYEPTNKETDEY